MNFRWNHFNVRFWPLPLMQTIVNGLVGRMRLNDKLQLLSHCSAYSNASANVKMIKRFESNDSWTQNASRKENRVKENEIDGPINDIDSIQTRRIKKWALFPVFSILFCSHKICASWRVCCDVVFQEQAALIIPHSESACNNHMNMQLAISTDLLTFYSIQIKNIYK